MKTIEQLWTEITLCDERVVEAERDAMAISGTEHACELAGEAVVAAKAARRAAIEAYLVASGAADDLVSLQLALERELVSRAIQLEVARRGGQRRAA